MAWKIRKVGTEVPVTLAQDGEDVLTAVYETPSAELAYEIAQWLSEDHKDEGPYFEQRFVLGKLLKRIDGAEHEDGTPFHLDRNGTGALTVETIEGVLEFVPALYQRALQFINRKGPEDSGN